MTKADLVVKGVQYELIDKETCFSVSSLKKKKIECGYDKTKVFEHEGKEYIRFSDMYFD